MKLLNLFSLSFGIVALSAMAPATLLTFDKAVQGGAGQLTIADLATYGDNVTGTGPGADTFLYGADYGFTPDVLVDWTATTGAAASTYAGGYGNLSNVVWGSGPSGGLNEVTLTLTAQAGKKVNLHEFTLAQWSNGTLSAHVAVAVDGTTVLDENRVIPNAIDNSNYRYLFATPYTGNSISITFGNGWWHAIDNVGFSQGAVPEPASMIALGFGALALIRRRRK